MKKTTKRRPLGGSRALQATRGSRALHALGAVCLALAADTAAADSPDAGNTIRDVLSRVDGAKTIITVRGSATPSFTAYRLEQPARLVVDLAGGRMDTQGGRLDGPIDVDSWAVSQIAFAQYSTSSTRTARVMVGLKRAATYDVKAQGQDLLILISPVDAPPDPAGAAARSASSAINVEAAKADAARQARLIEEQRRADAETARERAEADAKRAREGRDQALSELARVELDRTRAAEQVEAARARVEELRRGGQQAEKKLADAQAAEAQRSRSEERAKATAEQERIATLRAEAEKLLATKEAEAHRIDKARAEAEKLLQVREVEERRLEAVRDEAERLVRTRTEEQRKLDTLRAEAKKDVEQLAHARVEEQKKLDSLRAEAKKDVEQLARTRVEEQKRLDATRGESERFAKARDEQQRRADAARQEAERLAKARDDEQKRVDATRGESERLAKARDRDEGQRRVDATRAESERLAKARDRDEEQRRVDAARLETERLAKARDRDEEQRRVDAARLETERLARAREEAARASRDSHAVAASPAPRSITEDKPAPQVVARPLALPGPRPRASVAAIATPIRAKVTSLDFRDDEAVAQVIIGVTGDADYTVLQAPTVYGMSATEPHTATMRIRGAQLPIKLQRTLDTSAWRGPISSVSAYTDPDDAGAVRVVVRLASSVDADARRADGRIVWSFPKATVTGAFPPARVAGYGLSTMPLQLGPPPPMAGTGTIRSRATTVGPGPRKFSGQHIDLDFKDADVHNLLRLLADVGQVNIVTSDDVKGTVTIRMRDAPWDQALDVILRTKGLGQVREGNLIRVAPQAALEKELEAQIAQAKSHIDLAPLSTRLIPLSYAAANDLKPRVQDMLSPRGKVSVDERTNMLIVSDIAGNLALAEDLIRNLDTQTPQVLIEARIVEARTAFVRDIGIQWGGSGLASAATGNPTGIAFPNTIGVAGGSQDQFTKGDGLLNGQAASPNYAVNLPAAVGTGSGGALGMTFGSVAGAFNLNLRLSAAETTGNVRILSAPKITTLDNVQASIEQGTAIPISVVSAAGTNTIFVDAKLNLTVKPHVTNEGSIVMNVEITRNEPDFSRTGARGDPTIQKKQAKTEILVRDGDTAVIGGIYSRNASTTYSKIPWLGDIPVLGWLFKQKKEQDDRSELLIFITPRIINRQASIAGASANGTTSGK